MLVSFPRREYRTWIIDSRRWEHYQPRNDDIVIATYPKCGTTWMQRIVSLLLFQTVEPRPVMQISPWIDRRFPQPIEAVMEQIKAQRHRRFLKSHLPFDGLPFYDEVKYIHVARDGRDASMSFHNHAMSFTEQTLSALDAAGLADETIRRPYPRPLADPAQHFHRWLTEGAVVDHDDGLPQMSFFRCERSWWEARTCPNVLMVHYNDLKADLAAEMHRIADFLGVSVAPHIWPQLVEAAGFEAMRRNGNMLMGGTASLFRNGGQDFFYKGTNDRWRGVFSDADLVTYQDKLNSILSPDCAEWVTHGRIAKDLATRAADDGAKSGVLTPAPWV